MRSLVLIYTLVSVVLCVPRACSSAGRTISPVTTVWASQYGVLFRNAGVTAGIVATAAFMAEKVAGRKLSLHDEKTMLVFTLPFWIGVAAGYAAGERNDVLFNAPVLVPTSLGFLAILAHLGGSFRLGTKSFVKDCLAFAGVGYVLGCGFANNEYRAEAAFLRRIGVLHDHFRFLRAFSPRTATPESDSVVIDTF